MRIRAKRVCCGGRLRIEMKIFGLVQGISFRYYTIKQARNLDLSGWVKNEADSSLSIVAEGEEENLKKLIVWAKNGPPLAEIRDIKIKWKKARGEEGFKVGF